VRSAATWTRALTSALVPVGTAASVGEFDAGHLREVAEHCLWLPAFRPRLAALADFAATDSRRAIADRYT
jgi:hypothetical protein